MELKRSAMEQLFERLILLIVPYGIETSLVRFKLAGNHLLIVPYGIETIQILSQLLYFD